jgi:hypothetical protein
MAKIKSQTHTPMKLASQNSISQPLRSTSTLKTLASSHFSTQIPAESPLKLYLKLRQSLPLIRIHTPPDSSNLHLSSNSSHSSKLHHSSNSSHSYPLNIMHYFPIVQDLNPKI